jgi:hypothetical protein
MLRPATRAVQGQPDLSLQFPQGAVVVDGPGQHPGPVAEEAHTVEPDLDRQHVEGTGDRGGRGGQEPLRAGQGQVRPVCRCRCRIKRRPVLGGLINEYERAA